MNLWTSVRNSGRQVVIGTVATALTLVASSASAAVFYPSGSATGANNLENLDHDYYYSWAITSTQLSSDGANSKTLSTLKAEGITGAYITFKNLYNWDTNANVLHLDLLDYARVADTSSISPVAGTTTSFKDYDAGATAATAQSQMMMDAFDTSAGQTNNDLTNGAVARNDLSSRAFVARATSPTNTTLLLDKLDSLTDDIGSNAYANTAAGRAAWANDTLINSPGWSWSGYNCTTGAALDSFSTSAPGAGVCADSRNPADGTGGIGTGGYDYRYTFTQEDLNSLISFINGTGNIALGFDPDCHFYNDGISLTILSGGTQTGSAVPEPASLLLLGSGVLAAGRFRRKKN